MELIYHPESAYFLNQDKTLIGAKVTEVQADGRDAIFERVIEVSPNPVFTAFLDQVTIEQVEENTVRQTEEDRAQYNKNERQLIDKVKAEVMKDIKIPENIATASSGETSFSLIGEMSSEDLFKFKLAAFEIEEVKNSKNRELKAKVRKADNPLQVLAYTAALITSNE